MNKPQKLVVGNWKMHGSRASTAELLSAICAGACELDVGVAICVPLPFLEAAQRLVLGSRVDLGAQTVSEHEQGAYTGEVSAAMLREFGCRFVLVGHSERRMLQHESSAIVAQKASAARRNGLTPIVCVGESLEERDAGRSEAVVLRQIEAVMSMIVADANNTCVIAYEPVWAIGTGRSATPEQAQQVHATIRRRIAEVDASAAAATPILYGGSVKPTTAQGLFVQPDIDGALVGSASLVASDFLSIASAAADVQPQRTIAT